MSSTRETTTDTDKERTAAATRYYDAVASRPPNDALLEALRRFDAETAAGERFAVDLGCGEGRDSAELLRRGWRVLAIDAEPEGIRRLRSRRDLAHPEHLAAEVATFQTATWPPADLVNAANSIPFCPAADFPALWERIVTSIRRGSRFAGSLFGDRDDWATKSVSRFGPSVHHTRAEVDALLAPFDVEWLYELDEDATTAVGDPKHWHAFRIVARKR